MMSGLSVRAFSTACHPFGDPAISYPSPLRMPWSQGYDGFVFYNQTRIFSCFSPVCSW